jgi:transaldolase/glucose-6-phosphate isomerase
MGKIAVANAKVTYQRYLRTFNGPRWEKLEGSGARPQRLLWASTSTKNPNYRDTMYVDDLIGPNTVNTVPPSTLQAFLDHGEAALSLTQGAEQAENQLATLEGLGINLEEVTAQLQVEGVDKFVKPFTSLMDTIAQKMVLLAGGRTMLEAELGPYQKAVDGALMEIKKEEIMRRIWAHDYSVWSPDPDEITNRLGWLHTPEMISDNLDRIYALKESVMDEGYTEVLLLGMGGSSLAPELFSKAFGPDHRGLALAILDSTDPGAVQAAAQGVDPARTLFVVSTKSGGTVETLPFFKYFYNHTAREVGLESAGDHFVAITDDGSKLQEIAERYKFRALFLNDPNIGGRYSALSHFGLIPAGLAGVDLERLLDRALIMVRNIESCNCPVDGDNQAGRLGAIIGEMAKAGKDKLTIITSPALGNFGDWLEQLIAESTGKDGSGILPVVAEALGDPVAYGDDRLFVNVQLQGDDSNVSTLKALAEAGHPLVTLHLADRYDMGGQFLLWEMATAVAGHRLGIHPFNQPNVESAKILAREMVQSYERDGSLPKGETTALSTVRLCAFVDQARPGDDLALHAYRHVRAITWLYRPTSSRHQRPSRRFSRCA